MATGGGSPELIALDRAGFAARLRSGLRSHWPYILLTVTLALAGAAVYLVLAEERYEARAEVYVAPVPPTEIAALPALRVSAFAQSLPAAVRLTESPRVIARVRSRLGISGSRSAIADSVHVQARADESMLGIVGVAGAPKAAARIANAFAAGLVVERTRQFQQRLRRATHRTAARLDALGADAQDAEAASLANRLADYRALAGAPDPAIAVVRTAEPPSSPSRPTPVVIAVLAVTLGLLIGGVVAFALEFSNPTLISADMLAAPSGTGLLARIPRPTHEETRKLLLAPAMVDDLLKPVRQLSDSIGAILPNGSGPTAFLVTSADAREGAAIVAATVASVIADDGVPVALLDVDFERAPLRAIVNGNETPTPSVGELLTSGYGQYVHRLHRFEAGPRRLRLVLAAPSDHELRPSPYGVEALASQLKSGVRALVISAPPLPAKETAALLGLADVVIVVVTLDRTRRDRLTELRRMLALRHVESYSYVALEN